MPYVNPAYTLVGYDAHTDLYVYAPIADDDDPSVTREIPIVWYTESDLAWFRAPIRGAP